MDKKKILIVTAFPTHGAGSGALITTQAKSYIEDGHEVVIITGNNRTDFDKLDGVKYHVVPFTAETENPEKIEGQCSFNYLMFTTHTESTANFWNVGLEEIEQYMEQFKKAIKEEVETFNPDIIHTQHNWISSSIATDFNKPITLTIHGTDLMGYKKANEKLNAVNKKIEAKKQEALQNKNQNILDCMGYLEQEYSNYTKNENVINHVKQLIQDKKIDVSKSELMELIDLYSSRTLYKLYKKHADNSAKNSQKIIVISEEQKKEFCKLFPQDASKVELLENGYDPKTFYVNKEVKKEDVIPAEELDYDNLVLFVGKFADFKGIDALLNSAKIYEQEMEEQGKKVVTLIVGSGALESKLKAEAESLNLKHTHFLGRKNHEEICKLQNLADVSLIPSRNEPFGLVVIEGTACGHPVIATNSGGIPDILNINKQNMEEKSSLYPTPLGILVPPLPTRPEELSDVQKDKLDVFSTQFLFADDKEKSIKNMSEELGLNEEKIYNYMSEYQNTVHGMSKAVKDVLIGEQQFDSEKIAQYTQDTYAQPVIREKILGIFSDAINDYDKKKDSLMK